jgi:tRNA pseudouridine55 synthase
MKSASFHGLLVLDKPGGVTSRDVVNRVQGWFPRHTRLGHTGTLDPLATGVLVVCVGVATRLTEYVQAMDKTYQAGLLLGVRSDTDDVDGTMTEVAGGQRPDRRTVERALSNFIGVIQQVPPAYSAAKLSGQRAYNLARQGRDVTLEARPVRIDDIEVVAYQYPHLELQIRCGKGTYIRSLARDLGERLGCGALVEKLRRTRVGPFEATEALKLDVTAAQARASLAPLSAAVAHLPHVVLAAAEVRRLRQGQEVILDPVTCKSAPSEQTKELAVFDSARTLVATALVEPSTGRLRPQKVFPADLRTA